MTDNVVETWRMDWGEYLSKIFFEAPMSYISSLFFIFITLFLLIYCLMRSNRAKRNMILVGNMVFYMWSGWSAAVIVLLTGTTVYMAARKMTSVYAKGLDGETELSPKEKTAKYNSLKRETRIYLLSAMMLMAGYWVIVKAAGLMGYVSVESFPDMLSVKGIVVPLGISYYTLSSVGYLLDVYWRRAKAERNFLTYFAVMTYFPHILQGPIGKYSDLHKQMNSLPKFDYDRVCKGLQLAVWGYFKKMVIADRLNIFTTTIFSNINNYAGIQIIIAVAFSTAQLYADFSGCVDIAKGISQVIGIDLADNFKQPFLAKSAAEFWTRWHITLGAWTKDYLYMPIAVNPKFLKFCAKLRKKSPWFSSFLKIFLPSILVWLFTGFWHGTGIDYIIWGMYWCVLITLGRELEPLVKKLCEKLKINREQGYFRVLRSIKIFTLFSIGRMFTVGGGLKECGLLWEKIFYESRLWKLFDESFFGYGLDRKDFYIALIALVILIAADLIHEKNISVRDKVAAMPLPIRWILYLSLIFSVVLFGMYGPGFNAADFVYGRF